MPLSARTPSGILREALLEYSRDVRRTRERNRRRRRRLRNQDQANLAPAVATEAEHVEEANITRDETAPEQEGEGHPFLSTKYPSVTSAQFQHITRRETHQSSLREDLEIEPKFSDRIVPSSADIGASLESFTEQVGEGVNTVNTTELELEDEEAEMTTNQAKQDETKEIDNDNEPGSKSKHRNSIDLTDSDDEIYLAKTNDSSINQNYDDDASVCCGCGKKHRVARELLDCDGYGQSKFIQKVFSILLLKGFLILAFLTVVDYLSELKEFYKQSSHFHYISAGIYILIKITVRLTKNLRRKNCSLHILLLILDIIALGDFLACGMSHWGTAYFSVPRKILYSLGGTFMFFIFVGWFVAYDMRDGIMTGSALLVSGMMASHQILHGQMKGTGFDPALGQVAEEWICVLAVLGVTELIITIIMFELRGVLIGRRYSVKPSDWLFTSVYLI